MDLRSPIHPGGRSKRAFGAFEATPQATRKGIGGRPRASAARNTLPMAAARITETGEPLISAYDQMNTKGKSR